MCALIAKFSEGDLLLKHPFSCVIAGPSGSGKTNLARNIVFHFNKITTFKKRALNVLWIYGQPQSLNGKHTSSDINMKYLESLPTDEEISAFKTDVIVVDDLMIELGDSKRLASMFTKGSHHLNYSIFFLVQNFFYKAKEMRTITSNAHYIILMKNRRDIYQAESIARQSFSHNVRGFLNTYLKATRDPFSYLLIDNHPQTPDDFRLRSDILASFTLIYKE